MTVMERSRGSEKTLSLPEPLDYEYVDHLIDTQLAFYKYDDYDEVTGAERVITAAHVRGESVPTVGYARLMWEVNDDTYGWDDSDNDYFETAPTIWWQAGEREDFDEYPYEFGQIPLVADRANPND